MPAEPFPHVEAAEAAALSVQPEDAHAELSLNVLLAGLQEVRDLVLRRSRTPKHRADELLGQQLRRGMAMR